MEITIKKAKLTKTRTLEVAFGEYTETENGKLYTEVTKKCDGLCHLDLVNAFIDLVPHLKNICEFSEDDLSYLKVTGFSIGGSGDNEGVVLTGLKTLNSGKVLNICSPFQCYYDENYPLANDLSEKIYYATCEIEAYLKGKYEVIQRSFNFDNEDENVEVTIAEVKPKQRRKKVIEESIEAA